jgi:FLVCR family feline leukemia virus subgroup C receptor-related protein
MPLRVRSLSPGARRGGVTDQLNIDLAGAGFEFAILIGGIIIGGFVDRTKEYKRVTLACLAATFAVLLPLGLTSQSLGNEPALLVAALLGLGVACGPVQPINAELAVDVTYPGDETAVESVQQIGGNLVSALLVPLAEIATRQDFQLLPNNPVLASDIRGDVVLLMAITAITFGYFSGFNAPLRRSMADTSHSKSDGPEVINRDGTIDVTLSPEEEAKLQELNK